MSKRIHELAKEWAVAPKDLLTAVEKAGVRGKKSQSSLTDDEVQRVKETLGLGPRPAEPVGRPHRGRRCTQAGSRVGHGLCLLAWLDRRLERLRTANPSSVWPPRPSCVSAAVIRSGSPIPIESDAQP